jgi:acetyl-CoA carboxylase biotin carboxyl carrier protein
VDDISAYLSDHLPSLLELLQNSDLRELELSEGGMRVRVHRAPAIEADEMDGIILEEEDLPSVVPPIMQVVAPLVGTFYRASTPGTPPLVTEGSHVEEETVIGIIEALQVLTEVEAGCTGIVTSVLATDGQPVEYGQALVEVDPGG